MIGLDREINNKSQSEIYYWRKKFEEKKNYYD